jgi:glutamate carboxypeptidase
MGEMRTISAAQEARTKANMQAIVGSHLPHTDAEMHFQEGYPPMEEKPGNLDLQRQLSAISVALGAGPLAPNDPLTRGAGDISVVANTVAGALDGLGGSGGGAHSSDEFVDLKAMQVATQRAALLMAELTARR